MNIIMLICAKRERIIFNNIIKKTKLTISNKIFVLGPTLSRGFITTSSQAPLELPSSKTVPSLFTLDLNKNNKLVSKECTSLVFYGTNLGSNVNKGRFSVSLKNLICLHPPTVKQRENIIP